MLEFVFLRIFHLALYFSENEDFFFVRESTGTRTRTGTKPNILLATLHWLLRSQEAMMTATNEYSASSC